MPRGEQVKSEKRKNGRFWESLFSTYQPLPHAYDELFLDNGKPRAAFEALVAFIDSLGKSELNLRQKLASRALLAGGITFAVYFENKASERIFPFDVIPRIISATDWDIVDRGLKQRISALNMFLADVYGPQRIIREGLISAELVHSSSGFLSVMRGIQPPGGTHVVVAGIDLVRTPTGEFVVLEDNLRTPSGVSYVLENRAVMKRVLDSGLERVRIRPVDDYPAQLRHAMLSLAPNGNESPRAVVLTPGSFNSAYFEHSFLARRMGCDLVCPSDLFVYQDQVFVKTTAGPERVDVIYRRIDDEFLDPDVFRKDSLLGVRGLVSAYAKGNVALANAIGNGVADDKAMYPYVPDMVRFYLSEEPILGQVETFLCQRDADRSHVLANLNKMVVKEVNASGGYGMLMGHLASADDLDAFAQKIKKNPRNFIAQPLVDLSACPTLVEGKIEPRRVDLRPFTLTGESTWVLPGGLTRVALLQGSHVVNSSQGGGSKDTWVLEA